MSETSEKQKARDEAAAAAEKAYREAKAPCPPERGLRKTTYRSEKAPQRAWTQAT